MSSEAFNNFPADAELQAVLSHDAARGVHLPLLDVVLPKPLAGVRLGVVIQDFLPLQDQVGIGTLAR
eukprot:4098083-Alexandrium_andersonii.AAC.1